MKLANIKAARGGGSGDAAGTGLGPPPVQQNVKLGAFRQTSVMNSKSQDRVMQAEYKAQIDAVAKRGLSVLSED